MSVLPHWIEPPLVLPPEVVRQPHPGLGHQQLRLLLLLLLQQLPPQDVAAAQRVKLSQQQVVPAQRVQAARI